MASKQGVPPVPNKRGSKSPEQKLRNLDVEFSHIEEYRESFEEAGIYELIRIDWYLGVKQVELICCDISWVVWTEDALHITYKDQVCNVPNIGRFLLLLDDPDPTAPDQDGSTLPTCIELTRYED